MTEQIPHQPTPGDRPGHPGYAPPQYSPDGWWWWTGSEWVPIERPEPIRSEIVARLVLAALLSILLVLLAATWLRGAFADTRPADPVEQWWCEEFEDSGEC